MDHITGNQGCQGLGPSSATVGAEAPPAPNESQRLETLGRYQILDTPGERDFDDLVRLAAQICQTPISLVSLVDRDRQWFKGRYGLDLTETPRRLSFCAHTILNPEQPMEVPDTTQDQRFVDNELVTGPLHLRYYLGAPLVTPEGHALGTLCVLDKQPRQLTPEQKDALSILARSRGWRAFWLRQKQPVSGRRCASRPEPAWSGRSGFRCARCAASKWIASQSW